MFKNTCLKVLVIVFVVLVIGCGGESKKAAEKANVKPIADQILITDFEDSSMEISVFAGPQSKITAQISSEQVKNGKMAGRVEHNTRDWSGAVVVPPAEKRDWTGMKTFRMWVYGSNSKSQLNIDIPDAKNEFFRYSYVDDFEGWKELVIPFESFKSRTDWQPSDASINKKMDFPIREIQFCTSGFGKGVHYFDDIIIDSK